MRFACLGSGSEGNGWLIEAGDTRVLVDCGFTLADTVARLARLGVSPDMLAAVLVTHEHDDHAGGVGRLARRHGVPVYLTYGTLQAASTVLTGVAELKIFDSHRRFSIGDLEIEPYPVPHDAREPSQFVFSDGARRIGLLTDAGEVTAHMRAVLSGLDALLLECNHDRGLLQDSDYPAALKRRIAGRQGHLDNSAAAALLADVDRSRLMHVVAAHLSRSNNTPELARTALAAVLCCGPDEVAVAEQALGLDWRQVA